MRAVTFLVTSYIGYALGHKSAGARAFLYRVRMRGRVGTICPRKRNQRNRVTSSRPKTVTERHDG